MKRRTQTWLAVSVVAVGLLLAAILGLFAYMSATAAPLHSNAQDVPSVTRSAPLPKWADAVEQGRQIVRAGVTEQNLPGISVAVGVGGDIVWAEGFGWADLENRLPVSPEMRFRIPSRSLFRSARPCGSMSSAALPGVSFVWANPGMVASVEKHRTLTATTTAAKVFI